MLRNKLGGNPLAIRPTRNRGSAAPDQDQRWASDWIASHPGAHRVARVWFVKHRPLERDVTICADVVTHTSQHLVSCPAGRYVIDHDVEAVAIGGT